MDQDSAHVPAAPRPWWMEAIALLFLLGLLAEGAARWAEQEEAQRREARFQSQALHLQEAIQQQVARTGDLFRAVQGLFSASSSVNQERWDRFARDLEVESRHPTLRFIAWAPRVPGSESPAFEGRMRKVHGPGFRIWRPEGSGPGGDDCFPVALVAPRYEGAKELGMDLQAWTAAGLPWTGNRSQLGDLRLGGWKELPGEGGRAAFRLLAPLHPREGAGAPEGWITCVVDAGRFFGALLERQEEPLALGVSDGPGTSAGAWLWSNLPGQAPEGTRFRQSSLPFPGHTWLLRVQSTPGWEAAQPPGPERAVRTFGFLLALGAGAFLAFSSRARMRALEETRNRSRDLVRSREEFRRETLEHLQAQQAREHLMVTVNHGLRTPLTTLRGALAVLAEEPGPPPETRADLLAQAQRNAEKALLLVNDMVDLHRLEIGRLPLQKTEFNLVTALGEALRGVEALAAAQGRDLRMDCPPQLVVVADPTRLQQVLGNLLGNALRHGRKGTPIRVWAEAAPSGKVRVSVHNAGESLAESVRLKVFGLDLSTSTSSSGTSRLVGLGLPIARKLVEAMGGTMGHVRVEEGNTFWFEVPGRG